MATRFICVTSGKGGVGKTTVVSNLASALTEVGQNVIAVDANLTTPNLGLHLGYHLAGKTLHDVLRGKAKLNQAIYSHPFGFKILPASMSINDLQNVDVGRLPSAVLGLMGKADYVLMDSAAGLGREALSAMQASNEILVVTNPDLPSVADALKVVKLAENTDKKVSGVVVNRVRGKWHELSDTEIEKTLGHKILATIPEDRNVAKAVALKMPVTEFLPTTESSLAIRKLAHNMVGREFRYPKTTKARNLIDKLASWMSG